MHGTACCTLRLAQTPSSSSNGVRANYCPLFQCLKPERMTLKLLTCNSCHTMLTHSPVLAPAHFDPPETSPLTRSLPPPPLRCGSCRTPVRRRPALVTEAASPLPGRVRMVHLGRLLQHRVRQGHPGRASEPEPGWHPASDPHHRRRVAGVRENIAFSRFLKTTLSYICIFLPCKVSTVFCAMPP